MAAMVTSHPLYDLWFESIRFYMSTKETFGHFFSFPGRSYASLSHSLRFSVFRIKLRQKRLGPQSSLLVSRSSLLTTSTSFFSPYSLLLTPLSNSPPWLTQILCRRLQHQRAYLCRAGGQIQTVKAPHCRPRGWGVTCCPCDSSGSAPPQFIQGLQTERVEPSFSVYEAKLCTTLHHFSVIRTIYSPTTRTQPETESKQ